jgi:coniferyl-aldehyde dehydrogenase
MAQMHAIGGTLDPSFKAVDSDLATLHQAYERLRAAQQQEPIMPYRRRRELLQLLLDVTQRHQQRIVEAVNLDFGNRSSEVTRLGDLFPVVQNVKYALSELSSWMAVEPRRVSWLFKPGRARIHHQPLGVVAIIAPWNYPYQLAVGPLVFALAAGNRVLVKPSELTPHTAALMAELFNTAFSPDVVQVVLGGAEVASAVSSLPVDHIFYTGSARVGRLVMEAASKNLTPVTLELGGKSPAIVHESYPLLKAARRIVAGKLLNSGQTCVASDYLLIPRRHREEMIQALETAVAEQYPALATSRDYTSIINSAHYERLLGLVEDARQRGAKVIEVNPTGGSFDRARTLVPTLLTDVTDDMAVMQEEIFGPILPIKTYDTLEEAFGYVNARPRPLAFYYFDTDPERVERALAQTSSGGACINDTVLQNAQNDLPFGGIGASGMGAYHGKEGFEVFSHKRGVFYQGNVSLLPLLFPPYGKRTRRLLAWLLR